MIPGLRQPLKVPRQSRPGEQVTPSLWVLGASDPEMSAIEALLRECGQWVVYATVNGTRVFPGNAYEATFPETVSDVVQTGDIVYLVEGVDEETLQQGPLFVRIDHHREGDYGFGRPPTEFLPASSLGQVIAELARRQALPKSWEVVGNEDCSCIAGSIVHRDRGWVVTRGLTPGSDGWYGQVIPQDLVLTAAADHCLGAAYRGECPGVDPEALLQWRVRSRAEFQKRLPEEILADIEFTRKVLKVAPEVVLAETPRNIVVRDLRYACLVTTTLVAPFAEGATVDASGVGNDRFVVFDPTLPLGVFDEGSSVTSRKANVPELVEAAMLDGVSYLSGPLKQPDGRTKITCSGTADVVSAFLEVWAPRQGLTDVYGDPTRGFAGGYLSPE